MIFPYGNNWDYSFMEQGFFCCWNRTVLYVCQDVSILACQMEKKWLLLQIDIRSVIVSIHYWPLNLHTHLHTSMKSVRRHKLECDAVVLLGQWIAFFLILKENWNCFQGSVLEKNLWAGFYLNPSKAWSFVTYYLLRLFPDLLGTSKQYHCSPGANSNPPLQGSRKSIPECQMAKKWCSSGSGAKTDHHQKNRLWFTSKNPGSGYHRHRILPVRGFKWDEDNNCNRSFVCQAWWVPGFYDCSDCFMD